MKNTSFLTVCMSPTIQKTMVFPRLERDAVNRSACCRFDAAGKGVNIGRVLVQLGMQARHLTQLGGALRPFFLELCARDGLPVLWVESSAEIRLCVTLLEREEKNVTELVEESERAGEGTAERLLETYTACVSDFSTVIIAGSMAPGFPDTLIPQMVGIAREAGAKVILDIRGKNLIDSLAFGPDLIKPNLDEFLQTFAPRISTPGEDSQLSLKERVGELWAGLYAKHPCGLVLTRGALPLWYAEKGELEEYAFPSVEPLNTTGSGDAFTAGFAAALSGGHSFAAAVAEGSRCGALNAGLLRPGVIR